MRVSQMSPGRVPDLGEVRSAVEREWSNDKAQGAQRTTVFSRLLKQYEVSFESEPKTPAQAAASP